MTKKNSPKDAMLHYNLRNVKNQFMSDSMSPFVAKKYTNPLGERSVNFSMEQAEENKHHDELLRIESVNPRDFLPTREIQPFNLGATIPKNFRRLSKQNVQVQGERKKSIEETLNSFFDSKKLYIKTAQNAKILKKPQEPERSPSNA